MYYLKITFPARSAFQAFTKAKSPVIASSKIKCWPLNSLTCKRQRASSGSAQGLLGCDTCSDVCVCVCSVAQLCLTLWDPIYCNPPGSSVHGSFQVRILEQVAISYSRGSSRPRDWTRFSCISCIGSRILYHLVPPILYYVYHTYFILCTYNTSIIYISLLYLTQVFS